MHLFKARTVLIKSATSAPCCHSYLHLLHPSTRISTIKVSKVFFSKMPDIWRKPEKSNAVYRTYFTSIWEEWNSYLDLKITLFLTSALTTIKKSETKNRKKKIICKFVINTKRKHFLPKQFDNNKNKMIIANAIIKFMINHIAMSYLKRWIGNK